MFNEFLKDLKYSGFYVCSVYCTWKKISDINRNGCEIVRATVTPEDVRVCNNIWHTLMYGCKTLR